VTAFLARPVRQVAVVVPAHDEEQLLPACLRALAGAARHSPVPVRLVVVADACQDATVEVARSVGGPHAPRVLPVDFHNVGRARAAGVAAAIEANGTAAGLLLLCTDADSTVPAGWIVRHVAHITRGADLVLGTVRPTHWGDWPPRLAREYRRRYRAGVRGRMHSHVHGANLGVAADAYLGAGGFGALDTGEDVGFVGAAHRAGLSVVWATDLPVCTSTRPVGRAPSGFSAHLSDLHGAVVAGESLPILELKAAAGRESGPGRAHGTR
jgi:glycosyltransferase involved in cell wall biosynthesis